MKMNKYLDEEFSLEDSKIVILPVAFEGTACYGKGTAKAPGAIIDASTQLEVYDEELDSCVYKNGIFTADFVDVNHSVKIVIDSVKKECLKFLDLDKFVVVLGGEHSISNGYYQALNEKYENLSVVQLDAHADLRDEYEGTKFSHASVMARIRESCDKVVQIGIRSLSEEEAELVKKNNYNLYYAYDIYNKNDWIKGMLDNLSDNVFITIDADFFSWDIVSETGTPEPGGIGWYQALEILREIFKNKNVVGFDVVECGNERKSAFAMAKLVYKLLGYKYYLK